MDAYESRRIVGYTVQEKFTFIYFTTMEKAKPKVKRVFR